MAYCVQADLRTGSIERRTSLTPLTLLLANEYGVPSLTCEIRKISKSPKLRKGCHTVSLQKFVAPCDIWSPNDIYQCTMSAYVHLPMLCGPWLDNSYVDRFLGNNYGTRTNTSTGTTLTPLHQFVPLYSGGTIIFKMGNNDAVDERKLILCCALCCANISLLPSCGALGCSGKVNDVKSIVDINQTLSY
jgi:hypothetical protein